MASQYRNGRSGRKRRRSAGSVVIPAVIALCLIAALTAGGTVLSLRQSRAESGSELSADSGSAAEADRFRTTEDQTETASDETEEEGTDGDQTETVTEETAAEEETEDPAVTAAEEFAQVKRALTDLLTQDPEAFSNTSVNFETARQAVLGVDGSYLTGEDLQLYQVLYDHMNAEEDAYSFRGDTSMSGQPLCSFGESGLARFRQLVSYYTGSDTDPDTARSLMADELNTANADLINLRASDGTLASQAAQANRTTASSAYLYDTVTASSDKLKLACAPLSLENGWQEYALIQTYAADDSLSDTLKMYMQAYTKVYYALYGLVDISVNYGGWQLSDVQTICQDYFGAVSADYVQNLYNSVVSAPGELAGASLTYLHLDYIRQTLQNNIADYTEQTFIDFLFSEGPASIRVYYGWLGIGKSSEETTAASTDTTAAIDSAASTDTTAAADSAASTDTTAASTDTTAAAGASV
ncbi:MAG: hypothetical protein ACOX8B_05470 [Lachnospiraceae bacterium]|jgi:hypothetical protein